MNGPRWRRLAAGLATLAAFAGTAACRPEQPSYFPLGAGWQYGYRLELKAEGAPRAEQMESVSLNLSRRTVDGLTTTPRLFQDGRIVFYGEDGEGMRAVALQEPGDAVAPAAPGQYILKYPLEVGTHWRTPGRTVLLTQRFLSRKALPITIGIDLDYRVEKMDETVRVPAGQFSNCLKLVGSGQTTVNTADNQNILDVRVDIVAWYAPGVGLVKSVRSERAGEERAGNARLLTELDFVGKPGWFD